MGKNPSTLMDIDAQIGTGYLFWQITIFIRIRLLKGQMKKMGGEAERNLRLDQIGTTDIIEQSSLSLFLTSFQNMTLRTTIFLYGTQWGSLSGYFFFKIKTPIKIKCHCTRSLQFYNS